MVVCHRTAERYRCNLVVIINLNFTNYLRCPNDMKFVHSCELYSINRLWRSHK